MGFASPDTPWSATLPGNLATAYNALLGAAGVSREEKEMGDWFGALSILQKTFAICAGVGGLLFAVRLVLMFVGGDAHDGGADVEVDAGDGSVDHHDGADSDIAFKLLSFQGLTAFFMMFGLVGLAMSLDSGYGPLQSVSVALAAGLGTTWLLGKLFDAFNKVQHSGTINLRRAIGEEGTVYLNIPADAPGKIRLVIQGRLKVVDAVSEDKTPIATDARVRVVGLVNENVFVVKPV